MSRQTERAEFRKAMKRGERIAKYRKRQKAKATRDAKRIAAAYKELR